MLTIPRASVQRVATALALGLSTAAIVLAGHAAGWLHVTELKTLDHRFQRYADPSRAGTDLVLVAIDEESLQAFGRWPWPRDRYAYVLRYLKEAGARAVVFDLIFSEPDENDPEFDAAFAEAARETGTVYFAAQLLASAAEPPRPEIAAKASIPADAMDGHAPESTLRTLKPPIPSLAESARGIGVIDLLPDEDGTTRRMPVALPAAGRSAFLTLAAVVARDELAAPRVEYGDRVIRFGTTDVPTTRDGDIVLGWYGGLEQDRSVYRAYSIGAVLRSYAERREGRPPLLAPELFRDKIVFIAGTAAGTYDLRVTPLSAFTPGVLVHMTATDNLLHGGSLRVPPAAVFPATIVVLAVATSLTFVLLSRWAVKLGIIAAVAAGYYGIAVHAFTAHRLWLHLAWPEAAVALAYAGTATIEYFTEGRRRRQLRVVFDRYMGADVVEEITRNPDRVRLGGERRELTVFFSDVAGFTTLSEKLAPEALVELVNEYLAEMTAVIFHYRGNVNKYLGDGIMALFGAPLDDREHARLACFAALESQEVLQRLRDRWREAGRPELHARIGINTGALVVGNVGSSVRMEYTVMGDSANLASRLEGANKFYGTRILLGPRTYESARAFIEAREVDLLRVKGKYEPVQVYELLSRQGMLRPEQRSMLDQYAAGLQAYKARRFADAIERFEGALRVMPTDGPARLYVERSRSYVATPPAADWDGVYELHEK